MVEELRVNFRDVGMALQNIANPSHTTNQRLLPSGRLLRCGRVDYCTHEELGRPGAILNLRVDTDEFPDGFLDACGAVAVHCPAEDKVEKYDTSQHCVRLWIASVLKHFENPAHYPVLVHCKHGRDRTGIIVAALLCIVDTPPDLIRMEYALSSGARLDLFEMTLQGFGVVAPAPPEATNKHRKPSVAKNGWQPRQPSEAIHEYLRGLVDVAKIRSLLLSVVVDCV